MIRSEIAFDSNVILYLTSSDEIKAGLAEGLLKGGGFVSVQVLNEVVTVSRRKFRMSWPEVHEMLSAIRAACTTAGVSVQAHERGLRIAERYGYQVYDSIIVAAAIEAGCSTLYSEDMQDGQVVDRLTIRNPFAAL